jgi:molecular chaperone DnaK
MEAVNIGIDLGTTNSLIAKYENNKVVIYKNPIGQKETLASVVAYRQDRILIGDKAREYLTKDAINVFGGFKRKMGTDEKYYVVNIDDNVTPVDLSVLVLKELKKFIQTTETIEAAVITIPASFDSMQSAATIKAGELAGFKNTFLLQEPIAASLAFFNETNQQNTEDGYWLVYDFGGGTFDVALVKSSNEALKVIDHKGNNFLGGMDLDFAIIEELLLPEIIKLTGIANFEEEFRAKYGKYEKLYYQLLYYAEEAKKELSQAAHTVIDVDFEAEEKPYNLNVTITKQQLDAIFAPKINETIKLLLAVLEQNHIEKTSIKQIILVGGSTFLPQVREQLQLQTNIPIYFGIDPTTAVAVGAAYYAANKYYEPSAVVVEENKATEIGASILETVDFNPADVTVKLSYNKSSRDAEEVLLIFADGEYNDKYYRIARLDGGFDTGMVNLKSKKTEFLPLLSGINNQFTLYVFDKENNPIANLTQQIDIMQGKFSIDGQPLPHDICIEVDDVENNTTKLEVIFERNALLPQKRTLYREISKTIKKGSKDNLVINILEGDKNARPSSNLTIGFIEIAGKDLQSDIVKGSDIEIQIQLSESRELSTTIFIVMSQQEFKSVFSIAEKKINLNRLKEQYINLENELVATIKEFQYNDEEIWEIKANAFLEDLQTVKTRLFKLTEKDKSDEKYIIAEKIAQISQESDKLGGNERIATMLEDYLQFKTTVWQNIQMADFEKEDMEKQYRKMEASESTFMKSKNVSFISSKLEQLNDLNWRAMGNTTSFLITILNEYKLFSEANFTSYSSAKAIFKMADKALEEEKYGEFRKHIYHLSSLLKTRGKILNKEFNGTGIG